VEIVPVVAVLVIGAVGFCLMLAAVILWGRGSQPAAVQPGAVAHWPLAKRLMFIGAMLCMLFSASAGRSAVVGLLRPAPSLDSGSACRLRSRNSLLALSGSQTDAEAWRMMNF